MYPADWIWQKYGLCLGWRCSKCKEKVLARSLPFKGLRKRAMDPDEARTVRGDAAGADRPDEDRRRHRVPPVPGRSDRVPPAEEPESEGS